MHLDEGSLVAVRDGTVPDGEEAVHARDCGACADALADARARSRQVADALSSLDEGFDVAAAKAAVRRRLDERRATDHVGRAPLRRHLGRAAAILLLSAGAASALPWSPLRQWWAPSRPERATEVESSEPESPPAATMQDSPLSSVTADVPAAGLSVVVRGASPGSTIDVVWTTGTGAVVSAPAGSTFTYAEGRVEVVAGAGPLRVRLPSGGARVSLEVDGRLFLERTGDALELPGPLEVVGQQGVRFVVPSP